MIKLTINNQTIEVPRGATILEAARSLGIEIPTMCHMHDEQEHFTSCMVCLVKETKTHRFYPSCSMPVSEGMDITTHDQETLESRKAALELLLSEHVGDCEAPCQLVCPAHMNIPLMNRLIANGDYAKALQVVKRDIAIPAILGRICPAPCEAGCRRKQVDEAVAICHLKQFVADEDLKQSVPYLPQLKPLSGKKVAIIGSGPAGLAVAYYLQLKGHQAVVFDKNETAGGDLLKIEEAILPKSVIASEVALIAKTGVEFRLNQTIDEPKFEALQQGFDAVVLAVGSVENGLFGLKVAKNGLEVDKSTYQTSQPGVFAIGNAYRTSIAVRSVGQGKELASILDNYFKSGKLEPLPDRFNSKFGKLYTIEFNEYLKESVKADRYSTDRNFISEEAIREAERCMHCDCRNPESCKLRQYADEFDAIQKRFQTSERKIVQKFVGKEGIVYEPAKCIKCGICVRLTRQHQEEFGFTFIGRGFDVKIGVPFNESIQNALKKTASIVAKACPTGALAIEGEEEQL